MTLGELAIYSAVSDTYWIDARRKGAPFTVVETARPILAQQYDVGLRNGVRHPNQAKLMAAFMLTPEAQTLWEEVKNGQLDVKHVAKIWANTMEGYYDVALEATRTNADATRPAWLHIPFSKATPSTLQHPLTLSRSQPDGTEIAETPFFLLGGQKKQEGLYSTAKLSGPRTLLVSLQQELVKGLTNGQYMSLVYVAVRGAEPPLAVILLTVAD